MIPIVGFDGGRDENEATEELLNLPGFEAAFRQALQQAESGERAI